MTKKQVSFQGTSTSFLSSGGTDNASHYSVYVRSTNEAHRIRVAQDGTMSATGRDVTDLEREAVNNFIAVEHAEFLLWKAEFDLKYA